MRRFLDLLSRNLFHPILLILLVMLAGCPTSDRSRTDAAGDTAADPSGTVPSAGEAELTAEVPELDAFHEVIYELWHNAWPQKNVPLMIELLPQVETHVERLSNIQLPGILRDKKEEWDTGMAELRGTLETYRSAAAGDDSQALMDAVEAIHSGFEQLMRTVRPVMPALDAYHVELYKIYHYHLPQQQLPELRRTVDSLLVRSQDLMKTQIPPRFADIADTLKQQFQDLEDLTAELRREADSGNWDRIAGSVESVHDQYVNLESTFDHHGRRR